MANSKSFLQQIYPVGADDTEAEVDIIAVHGLDPLDNSLDATKTWSAPDGKLWLTTFETATFFETSWPFVPNLAAIEHMWTTSCGALPILYDVSACQRLYLLSLGPYAKN